MWKKIKSGESIGDSAGAGSPIEEEGDIADGGGGGGGGGGVGGGGGNAEAIGDGVGDGGFAATNHHSAAGSDNRV